MTNKEHIEIASGWFESLNQGDVKQLVSLYSNTQFSFHPTLWNEVIRTRARARDYFVDFLAKQPRVHSYDGEPVSLSDHKFLYTGVMTLSFEVDNHDSDHLIKARFSFIWGNEGDNQWKILHHHNSVVFST